MYIYIHTQNIHNPVIATFLGKMMNQWNSEYSAFGQPMYWILQFLNFLMSFAAGVRLTVFRFS